MTQNQNNTTPKQGEDKNVINATDPATTANVAQVSNDPTTDADAKDKKPKKETVVVEKDTLNALMAQIEDLTKKVNAVSDKGRLEKWDAKENAGKSILPTVKINMLDGQKIIGWRTITNEAEDRNGVYYENQVIEVMYQDQSVKKMHTVEFYRYKQQITGEVVSQTIDENGEKIVKVRLADGEELSINIKYVN